MRHRSWISILALLLLAAPGSAEAGTILVTIGSSDPIDINPSTARIEDLPGPDGEVSFSEAMIASNNTPGLDTIGFNVPQSDWTFQWLYPGRAVVRTTNDYYWRAYDAVTIDGTTQTAFTGDTNPNGAEVVLMSGHPYLNAGGCTVLGLDSSSISITGSGGLVADNTGISLEFYGGSGALIRDNTGGTLKIDRSSGNVAVGNTFQRVRVLGWIGGGQPAVNNRIGGPNPEDRNVILGLGTWNSEGYPSGHAIQLFNAIGTIIENNSIGTTSDGMEQGSQAATMGIWFDSENHDTIVRNNRIAGILGQGIGPHFYGRLGWAIYISGTGSGYTIVGNTIGLNGAQEPVLGSVTGIDAGTSYYPTPPTAIRIGGTGPGEGNVIAGHRFNGITVGKDMRDVRISGNSVYGNHDLGIDLVTSGYVYGVTPNDPLDGDSGGNGLQNFPEIGAATTDGASVRVTGVLNSSLSSQFTIDFFASPACNATGYGEGQRYLGSAAVATSGSGTAAFDAVLPASIDPGWVATATATLEPTGATSEFSACVVFRPATTEVAEEHGVPAGATLRLLSVGPNPFSRVASIRYALGAPEKVRLEIADVSGRSVRVLVDRVQSEGRQEAVWDRRGSRGEVLPPGVYFYNLRAGGQELRGRIVLVH